MSTKSTTDTDPVKNERTGNVREVGAQAIWSLSSCKPGFGVDQLRDDRVDTYWQSDGQLPHLVNIQFQRKTTVSDIYIYTDYKLDESYTPNRISIRAGTHFNDLQEVEVIMLNEPTGWVHIPIKDIREKPVRMFMIQIAFSKDGEPLDKDTRTFIDNQINHYVELVTRSHGLSPVSRNKRNVYVKDLDVLSEDFIGVYVLNGFLELPRIPVMFPKDIILFKHDFGSTEVWYVATLQTSRINQKKFDYLVIYRYEDEEYIDVAHVPVTNGEKLQAHTVRFTTYIVVAENHADFNQYPTHGSGVYIFNADESLSKIQTLEVSYPSDIAIWEDMNEIFMAITQKMTVSETGINYEGPNGEFILLVSCKDEGVKVFQYDGWRFIESEVQYTGEAFGSGILNMFSYIFYNEPIIVIANKNDAGNMLNVFTPTFTYQNVMNEFQDDMYTWCQETLKAIDDITDLHELEKLVDSAPSINDAELILTGRNIFQNAIVDNLVLSDNKVTDNASTHSNANFINIQEQITKKHAQLKYLEEKVSNNKEPLIMKGDVHVKNLNLSNDKIIFEDIRAKTINKEKMDKFFNDIIFLDDSFLINDNFEFEDVIFDGLIKPKFLNSMPGDEFIFTSTNVTTEIDLIVEGTVTVEELYVEGVVDDVRISEETVLLIEGDQTLEGSISLLEISAEHLEVEMLNYINITSFEERHRFKMLQNNITSLIVQNITLGFVNALDMKSLDTLVLRTRGDQEILGNYKFDTLIVEDFDIDGLLSGIKVPDNLTFISNATNLIEQDLIFTEDLYAETLHVIQRLNQIPVYNGKIDILLNDYPEMQYISGQKTFESLNILGPIQLRGRIHSEGLDRMSPIITNNLTLVGDYTVLGGAVIEKLFKFGDITESSGTYSMSRLEEFGLKLTDTEVPLRMDLKQELNIEEIEVDSINGVNIESWIILDGEPKIITGRKIFKDDVYLNGEACILSINGNSLDDLYENTLHIAGDQYITGKHRYSNVTLIRAVSNNTFVNNKPWDTVMTINENQYINGTTTIRKSVNMSSLKTNSIDVKGKILGINFEEMISDTVFTDTETEITGHKHFEDDLIFNKLNANTINDVNIEKLLLDVEKWSGDVHIDETLQIKAPIKIDKIFFHELNGLKSEDFGKVWLLKEGNQTINHDQYFTTVNCNKNVNTASKTISNVDLQEILDVAVRTDEDYKLNSAHFLNGIESKTTVLVSGKVKNINITDAVLIWDVGSQTINAKKNMLNNITVYGYLHVNGLLSGINLTKLEQFINPSSNEIENLFVHGNITFLGDTNLNYLNEHALKDILENAWFTDRKTDFKGYVSFENVIFEDEVIADGYVDDVNLDWLAKNYFSKTKNQSISAKLDFTDGVIFGKDITAEKGIISGSVSGIKIEDFNASVLQNGDQIFNFDIEFDDIEVKGEIENGLINGLNLSTDVMRSDVFKNIVTGKKIIENMKTTSIALPKGRNIQNVNLDHWFQNAVLKNGTFTIVGLKTFTKNVKFEQNVELDGLLNSNLFTEEYIMTTNTKQNIYSKKTFGVPLYMENIKVKGKLNDIDIDNLIQNRVDKTKNADIYAPKNFYNTINASNVNIEQLYQGIDVSKLLHNIASLDKIENYEQEYGHLLNFSEKLLTGLKHQASFLKAYQVIQTIITDDINYVIPVEKERNILAFIHKKSRYVTISFYNWNNNSLVLANEFKLKTKTDLIFVSPVFFKNNWYLFLEEYDNPNS
ncbi:Anaphase Promoting Complex subunit 10, partial [Carabus blaptoides fortunei]